MGGKIPLIGTWMNGAYMLVFLFLAVGAIWAVAGIAGVALPTIALPFTMVSGGTGAGAAPTVVTTQGACPSTGVDTIYTKGSYDDPTTGNLDTLVATNYFIYRMADPTTVKASGTTSTGGYTSTVNDTVNCGESANVFVGDSGTTYYYVKKSLTASDTQAASSYVSAKLKRSSAATMTFDNTTSIGQTTTAVVIGSGETNTDATVNVKAGSFYYGDGAFEICAQFDSANFSKVSFGATATPIAPDPTYTAVAGMTVNCYEVTSPILYNNQVIKLPVVIQAISGVNPTTNSLNVSVRINDKACYLKNGECLPSYINTDTNADLGLAAVATSMAVKVS